MNLSLPAVAVFILLNTGLFVFLFAEPLVRHLTKNGRKLLPRGLQWLHRWQLRLGASHPSKQPYFELTPSDNIDRDRVYADRLQWALDHPDTSNIAITGPYGSGKSSIIKTFQKNHPQYAYLNVSLASFKDEEKAANIPMDVIELSILQQIFYHVTHKTIAGSRFSRIKKIAPLKLILRSISVLALILCLVILIKPDALNLLLWWPQYYLLNKSAVINVSALLTLTIAFTGLYALFKLYSDQKLEKINLKSGEIALAPKTQASVLNKNLDEILYFFEVTKYNVVILEDLDRFNNPDIFSKLREVNSLINNAQQVGRKVTFIYALKDDVFTNEPRTKFFDFIIPVIPIVNVTNASEVLLKWRETNQLDKTLSTTLINDIGLYLDDMRLLKNILNEFLLYRQSLKGFAVKDDQLLALIVYKNKNPQDFSELYNNRGHVAELFKKKSAYITQLGATLREKIKQHEELIRFSDNATAKNAEELRGIYIAALLKQSTTPVTSIKDKSGNWIPIKNFLEESYFNLLRDSNPIRYLHQEYYANNHGTLLFTFKELEQNVSELSYDQRRNQLMRTGQQQVEKLKRELEQFQQELNKINQYALRKVVEHIPVISMDEFFAENPLLAHFIRYGYINEDYPYYISQFHEGSMTRSEYEFLLSVKNQEPRHFDFPLTRVLPLLEKMRSEEWEKTEILNTNLFDAIWSSDAAHKEIKAKILQQFKDPNHRSIAFVEHHVDHSVHLRYFLNDLAGTWRDMWTHIDKTSNATSERKDKYLTLLLKYASLDHLLGQNMSGDLYTYIADKNELLKVMDKQLTVQRLFEVIAHLDIRLANVDISNNREFAEAIYHKNLYALNPVMIKQILTLYGGLSTDIISQVENAHYSIITRSKADRLQQYIEDDMDDYVENTLLALKDNTKEEQELMIGLLNKEMLDVSLKKRLIHQQPLAVESLENITEHELWPVLLEQNKVSAHWINVINSYSLSEAFIPSLITFLNNKSTYEILGTKKLGELEKPSQELLNNFTIDLLLQNELLDEAYTWLLQSVAESYDDLDFSNLDALKVRKLIHRQIITLTKENFDRAKALTSDFHMQLIQKNPSVFLDDMNKFSLTAEEYNALLLSDTFSNVEQKNVALWLDPSIYTSQPRLAGTVAKIFIKDSLQITVATLSSLIDNLQVTETKIQLLYAGVLLLTTDEISSALLKIGGEYGPLEELNKTHYVLENELNRSLLTRLEHKGYISSFHSTGKNEFKVNAKRNRD